MSPSGVEKGRAVKCIGRAVKCIGRAVKCIGRAVKCIGRAVKCIGRAVRCIGGDLLISFLFMTVSIHLIAGRRGRYSEGMPPGALIHDSQCPWHAASLQTTYRSNRCLGTVSPFALALYLITILCVHCYTFKKLD